MGFFDDDFEEEYWEDRRRDEEYWDDVYFEENYLKKGEAEDSDDDFQVLPGVFEKTFKKEKRVKIALMVLSIVTIVVIVANKNIRQKKN